METINLRFTLDAECPIDEYLDDGLCWEPDDAMIQDHIGKRGMF